MTALATMLADTDSLRVFIAQGDAAAAAAVARTAHRLVRSREEAEVVLRVESGSAGEPRLVFEANGHDRAGLLPLDASGSQIDAALRAVAAGLVVRGPESDAGFDALEEGDRHALLTPREMEVLTAIGEGLTNKEIARRLAISLHTVKFHLESIFRKLGVGTRTGAVKKAAQRRQAETLDL